MQKAEYLMIQGLMARTDRLHVLTNVSPLLTPTDNLLVKRALQATEDDLNNLGRHEIVVEMDRENAEKMPGAGLVGKK